MLIGACRTGYLPMARLVRCYSCSADRPIRESSNRPWTSLNRSLTEEQSARSKPKQQDQKTVSQLSLNYRNCGDAIHNMLNANFHQVFSPGRAYSLQVTQYKWLYIYLPIFGTSIASDGRSRRCQLALDLTVRGTATFTRLLHSPGDCKVVWCWFVKIFDFVALLGDMNPVILRHFHPFVAEKGDCPGNGDVEPCSNHQKKQAARSKKNATF